MAEAARRDRGGFGPVVLAGLASAGLAAVAATRSWVTVDGARVVVGGDGGGVGGGVGGVGAAGAGASDPTTFPLASALSLVLLAAWGVLLVTRGRVRRAFAGLAVLASVGLVVTVVTAAVTLPGQAEEAVSAVSGEPAEAAYAVWFYVAAVVSLLAVVPTVLAVRLVPRWPEMGSRYDAPADERRRVRPGVPQDGAPTRERDLWRSMDEGHDPTDGPDPAPDH